MSRVPQNFSIFMGTGTAKIMNCCSTTVRQKGRRIVAQCHVIFLCTATSCSVQRYSKYFRLWLWPIVILSGWKLFICLFPEKLSIIYIYTCNKTSGYNLMRMLFSPRAAVSSLGTCIIHAEEGTRHRASTCLNVLAMYIMQVCATCVCMCVCVCVCVCACVCVRARA